MVTSFGPVQESDWCGDQVSQPMSHCLQEPPEEMATPASGRSSPKPSKVSNLFENSCCCDLSKPALRQSRAREEPARLEHIPLTPRERHTVINDKFCSLESVARALAPADWIADKKAAC